jgi:3-(3-hydroxy-phenyl)propionate hydroxylase
LHEGETPDNVDVAALVEPWTAGVPVQLLRKAEYTFRAKVADRWRQGRVFLLGDAAHLTPPFVGQGLGSGLRDAANLAWKLALVLDAGADESILGTYESERKPHATRMIRIAVALGWAMTGGDDFGAAVRRRAIVAASRIPGFAGLALKTASPRLGRGPLVRRWPGDRLAGTLCPQPWIRNPTGRQRLDDVLGGSFGIVHTGELDPETASLARRLDAVLVDADGSTDLAAWLGGTRAAVIRPDRVVLATLPHRDTAWLRLLPTEWTHPAKEHIR